LIRERLAEPRSAGDLVASVVGGVQQFAAGAPQHDDMTLVAVNVL
jgi:serine phosphatase RsbU (regulator of sigma subunit)